MRWISLCWLLALGACAGPSGSADGDPGPEAEDADGVPTDDDDGSGCLDDRFEPEDDDDGPSTLDAGGYYDLVLCEGDVDAYVVEVPAETWLRADLISDASASWAIDLVIVQHGERRWMASGSARVEVIPNTQGETLRPFVHRSVRLGTRVVTDGWSPYRKLARQGYVHEAHVLHNDMAIVEAVQPKVHLLFSNAKAWLNGTFPGVTARYLAGYLAEFTYRFNRRRRKQSTFGFMARRVDQGSWTSFEGLKPLGGDRRARPVHADHAPAEDLVGPLTGTADRGRGPGTERPG